MPLATGIGGGLSAAYMLGLGRDNTATSAARQQASTAGGYTPFTNQAQADLYGGVALTTPF